MELPSLQWQLSTCCLWAGYISRIYPESTQELNQILGPFWSVYKAESPQDLKKSVNKPELTQKVFQILGPVWFVCTFFKILGTFCCVNKPERAQNLIQFLGTFWVNSANVATPLKRKSIHNCIKTVSVSTVTLHFVCSQHAKTN